MRRNDLRYIIYRIKNGNATPEQQQIFEDKIAPRLGVRKPEDFPRKWDVTITKTGDVLVFDSVDKSELHELLQRKSDAVIHHREEEFTERQQAILQAIEDIMLTGVTSWRDYNTKWGVNINQDNGAFSIVLYNVQSSQKEVTDEMIRSSIKGDGSEFKGGGSGDGFAVKLTNFRPATEDEAEKIKRTIAGSI